MTFCEDIQNRTFGVEIEMCNLDRQEVSLPEGYSWSKDEEIVNTDGSSNKRFGGEVNTPPLHITNLEELHTLRGVYESMVKAGGKMKWSIDTHIHIYVGDLSVEQLKKVYLFFYVCYPYFKQYAHISDWDELTFNCKPRPTEKFYDGVLRAQSFDDLQALFTNQSKKGFIRHAVNISAYFKTKTIEFRTFHATENFYLALNCVFSAYRIFYYAVNHELEDFQNISSYEEFCKVTKLKYTTPPELVPLLYQGNPYSAIETFQTKSLPYNSKQASALWEAIKNHGHKELCIVNGFMYYYELFFMEKVKVSIYAQDPYCHLLYLIANGKITLTYREKLGWLEDYNKPEPLRQMALALYASKLQKTFMSESARNEAIFEALKIKARESIEKTEKACEKLLRLLTTCEYHVGTLQDAIEQKKVIFFNYGKDKQQKRSFKLISENSDLEMDFDVKRNDYYEVVETLPENTCFYFISNSPYLRNMHKLAMWNTSNGDRWSAGRFLYCNKPSQSNQVTTSYKSNHIEVNEIVPPDDLVIDDPNKLSIAKVNATYLHALQKKYIKKVDQASVCTYAFVVMYEKYTLGGFGFTLPQHKGYDLFQLTDFCTNNNIPRLAKLILLCIQATSVQRELSRRMHKLCEKVISCAYTHKPVSMKYRGVYTKVKEHCTSSYLAYEGQLGKYATNKEVIDKYQKMLNNGSN
ncbi:MAG: amidoligase family protein [Bacteroidales bacterium]|nr:amidoligase family protein [Bacteroidales bacterium]